MLANALLPQRKVRRRRWRAHRSIVFGNALGNAAIAGIEHENAVHEAEQAKQAAELKANTQTLQSNLSAELQSKIDAQTEQAIQEQMGAASFKAQATIDQQYDDTEQMLANRFGSASDPALARVVNPYGVSPSGTGDEMFTTSQTQFVGTSERSMFGIAEAPLPSNSATRVTDANRASLFANASSMAAKASDGLSMFRYGSATDAVAMFAALSQPITAQTHYEVGANVLHDAFGYYLDALYVTPSTTGTEVDIPTPDDLASGTQFVAFTHTHPVEVGFSGDDIYWNQKVGYEPTYPIGGLYGDIGTAIQTDHVDAYVVLPSGTTYRFDYNGFIKATQSGQWTVYAKDYISKVHP